MNTYAIYKLLKDLLKDTCSVFYYTGQYLRDKNKTVYKVPAIYIQMPPGEIPVDNFGQIRISRQAPIRIHYISQAPFATLENQVQDSAVSSHAAKVMEIINRLSGAELKDGVGRLVTGQCLVTGIEAINYTDTFARSVIRVNADLYDYSGVKKVKAAKL